MGVSRSSARLRPPVTRNRVRESIPRAHASHPRALRPGAPGASREMRPIPTRNFWAGLFLSLIHGDFRKGLLSVWGGGGHFELIATKVVSAPRAGDNKQNSLPQETGFLPPRHRGRLCEECCHPAFGPSLGRAAPAARLFIQAALRRPTLGTQGQQSKSSSPLGTLLVMTPPNPSSGSSQRLQEEQRAQRPRPL